MFLQISQEEDFMTSFTAQKKPIQKMNRL